MPGHSEAATCSCVSASKQNGRRSIRRPFHVQSTCWESSCSEPQESRNPPSALPSNSHRPYSTPSSDGSPRSSRPDAVGELLDKHVVVLDRRVVALPRHRDPVLRSRQFVFQPHELVVALQLRIVLLHPHQRQQRHAQPVVGRKLLIGRLRRHQPCTRIRNVSQDRLLNIRIALHRCHQVRDQVGPPLQVHVDVGERRIHVRTLLHHLVLRAVHSCRR